MYENKQNFRQTRYARNKLALRYKHTCMDSKHYLYTKNGASRIHKQTSIFYTLVLWCCEPMQYTFNSLRDLCFSMQLLVFFS